MTSFRTLTALLSVVAVLCLLTACNSDSNCNFPTQPIAPTGYTITQIGTLPTLADGLQMLDAQTGYMLGSSALLQTTDGGSTWSSTPMLYPESVDHFVFTDANTGYFTRRIDNTSADLLKTIDGGQTFTELTYANLDRSFSALTADEAGRIYGVIGGYEDGVRIARSDDEGQTFTPIYTAVGPYISTLTIFNDRLYFIDDGLRITTLDGEVLHSAELPLSNSNPQLLVLAEDEVLYTADRGVFRTTDNGTTWSVVDPTDETRLLGGSEAHGTLMVVNREYCGDNLNQPTALALLDDDLAIAITVQDFDTWSVMGVLTEAGTWLLMRDGVVYRVAKE